MGDKMKADRVQEGSDSFGTIPQGWELVADGTAIRRRYPMPSYRACLAFAAWVGELAEAADHHPDLDVGYGAVSVTLSTHSEGTVTAKDLALARQIDHRG